MDHRLHARFGLKWNPFLPDVPTSALRETPQIASFRWAGREPPAGAWRLRDGERRTRHRKERRAAHRRRGAVPGAPTSRPPP